MKIRLTGLLLLVSVTLFLSGCLSDTPVGPSFQEQLQKDIVIIDKYLADNNIVGTVKDQSGARYLIGTLGDGALPTLTDTAYISLKSTVMSTGTVLFDSEGDYYSVLLGEPTIFGSWSAVVPKIKRGSTFKIFSPSGLAYGSNSSADGKLPANANMIFEMKLFNEKTFNKAAQFTIDTTAIEAYLANNSVTNVIKDPSGLRYVITKVGTGAIPKATSTISFTYEGKFLKNKKTFEKSTSEVSSALSRLIKGFQIAMPLLKSGSIVTLYVPSSLAYGLFGLSGTIPSNSNLIFEVELVGTN
jgi:FKBP-type peptidyl-prolyl cis-trans isomerase FkpA